MSNELERSADLRSNTYLYNRLFPQGMHDEVGEQMPAPRGRGSSRGGGQGRGDGYYSRVSFPNG